MPDALLLDWEGCLTDTLPMRQAALQRALRDEGFLLGDDDCARCCAGASGDGARKALAVLGIFDPVVSDLVSARATRAFAERLAKGFVVRPGAREFMEQAQLTTRIAIVTRASRSETDFVLRLSGLESAVSTIVSTDDEREAPPSPASFLAAVAQLSRRRVVRPEHSIGLASSSEMLKAARSAALRSVALCAPAHVALDADGAIDALDGLTVSALSRIAGIPAAEHTA